MDSSRKPAQPEVPETPEDTTVASESGPGSASHRLTITIDRIEGGQYRVAISGISPKTAVIDDLGTLFQVLKAMISENLRRKPSGAGGTMPDDARTDDDENFDRDRDRVIVKDAEIFKRLTE